MRQKNIVFIEILLICLCFYSEAAGGKVISKAIEECLNVAAKQSGRVLSKPVKKKLGNDLVNLTAKYGDEILPVVRRGGLETIEQGTKHGDEFWRLCREVPEASRSLALHADELIPLSQRIGPQVLRMESKLPGISVKIAHEFGDDGVRMLANSPSADLPVLLGYAAKADTPATKELLLKTYCKSSKPTVFLNSLSWKTIMSTGLSSAAIIGAYKISDGVEEGLKDPKSAVDAFKALLSPVQWIILAIAAILLFPLGVKSIRKGISAWGKNRQKKS